LSLALRWGARNVARGPRCARPWLTAALGAASKIASLMAVESPLLDPGNESRGDTGLGKGTALPKSQPVIPGFIPGIQCSATRALRLRLVHFNLMGHTAKAMTR